MSRSFSNIELTAVATLLIASIFSLIVMIALIIEKKGNKHLRNLLLIILFGNFLYTTTHFLGITGTFIYVPFRLRVLTPIYYLIPPAVFFYVVTNLNETFKYRTVHLLHLLPFFVSIIDNAPTLFLNQTEINKLSLIVINNYPQYGNFEGVLFKVKYNYLFRMFFYTFYLLFSWRYYYAFVSNTNNLVEKRIFQWIKNFLIVLGIFVSTTALSLFYNFKYILNDSNQITLTLIPFISVACAVILLCAFIFFNPILLYGIPRIQELNKTQFPPLIDLNSTMNGFHELNEINEKFTADKIELNEDTIKELQLAKSIIKEIKELQLYKDTKFSLAKASVHFNIPVHHISFVLNNQLKKSFPDIVSEMRIEHAIALIETDNNKKYTLEAIGNMSGFHSRTTFYVSFKKHTGVSPLEYSNMTK